MQLVLSNNRVVAHGENFIALGGTVINTGTGKKYENATVAECDGCPSDIDTVGYEYHAGVFVPCAPYGKGNGNIMVACQEDCGTPKDSGIPLSYIGTIASYFAFVGNVNTDMVSAALGMNNEDDIVGVGRALAMYARFKDPTITIDEAFSNLIKCNRLSDINDDVIEELNASLALRALFTGNDYAWNNCIIRNSKNIVYKSGDESAGISFSNGEVIIDTNNLYSQSVKQNSTITSNNIPTNGGRYLYLASDVGYFDFKLLDKNGNTCYEVKSGKSSAGAYDVSTLDEFVLSYTNTAGFGVAVRISSMMIINFKPTNVTVYE